MNRVIVLFVLGTASSALNGFTYRYVDLLGAPVGGISALAAYAAARWARLRLRGGVLVSALAAFAAQVVTGALLMPFAHVWRYRVSELDSSWIFEAPVLANDLTQLLGRLSPFGILALAIWWARPTGSDAGLDARLSLKREETWSMGYSNDEVNRHAWASAVLLGSLHRQRILAHLKEPYRARSIEHGLDCTTLARIAVTLERRETGFQAVFTILGGLALAFAAAGQTVIAVVLLLGLVAAFLVKRHAEDYRLAKPFHRDDFDPDAVRAAYAGTAIPPDIELGIPDEKQNVAVYRGFSPFEGAGEPVGAWSFSIDISRTREFGGDNPVMFSETELKEAIDSTLREMARPGLSTTDYLFVNGADIRHNDQILTTPLSRPRQRLDPNTIEGFVGGSDRSVRHYTWVQITDWGHELCFSYFLRCVIRGRNLFVETSQHLLTPLADTYRRVDAIRGMTFSSYIGWLLIELVKFPFIVAFSPLLLLAKASSFVHDLVFGESAIRREVQANPLYNYGAASLRESMSSRRYLHYYQRMDTDFHRKSLDSRVLDAIIDFLDAHGIDTSEMRERQSTIMNHGIVVQGDFAATNVAVGKGASARHGTAAKTPGERIRNVVRSG